MSRTRRRFRWLRAVPFSVMVHLLVPLLSLVGIAYFVPELWVLHSAPAQVGVAEEPPDEPLPRLMTFARDVQPILLARCGNCHTPPQPKSKLDLTSLAGIRNGGAGGNVLVPGNLKASELWQMIVDGEMPPAGQPQLTGAEKKIIGDWITTGATNGFVRSSPFAKPTRPADPQPLTVGDPGIVTWTFVSPIFRVKCLPCHGGAPFKGQLDLGSVASILKGGGHGHAITPGSPDKSLLWFYVADNVMPPEGSPPLTESEKRLIYSWIRTGADRN